MINKNLDRIIKSIQEVTGNKKCSLHEPWFDKSEIKYLIKVIKSNSVSTYGGETVKFENEIKKFTGSKYAVALINGSTALYLSLYLIGVNRDTEVLVPALNYIASANAVVQLGGTPHFVDVEEQTLGPDVEKLDSHLSSKCKVINGFCYNKETKKKIVAIVVTHIFGHPAKIKGILRLCSKYKIELIEDAAEALGSFYHGKHVGYFGRAGVLSFNGNKIITTGGGGAIITNSKKFADKIKLISTNFRKPHRWLYKHNELGFNYRMPSLNAQLGIAQIKKIKNFIKLKRSLYQKYKAAFTDIKELKLMKEMTGSKSNYWLQTLILNKADLKFRNLIIKKTNDLNIGTRPVWQALNKNNHLKCYPKMDLKNAINLEKRIINLPSSPILCQKKK
jgi:perosamine synthetase